MSRRTIRWTDLATTHNLRRWWSLACVLILALSVVLASVPDVSAAIPDHHGAAMEACADCPDSHHDTENGTMRDCHHVMSVALATLPQVAEVSDMAIEGARHTLPSAETGSHRSPERDLPPPRS